MDKTMPLRDLYNGAVQCLKCQKLRVDRKSKTLECQCVAFDTFCFTWEKNRDVPTHDCRCWGFCGSEDKWNNLLDEVHEHILKTKLGQGLSMIKALNYIDLLKKNETKLSSTELVGLKELYYDETHPSLTKAPSNESVGKACTIIKKNPLLDGEMSGKSWKGIQGIDMSTWDKIEENKKKKADDAKKEGRQDPTKDLKGMRKGVLGVKEKHNTDTTIVKEKKLKHV